MRVADTTLLRLRVDELKPAHHLGCCTIMIAVLLIGVITFSFAIPKPILEFTSNKCQDMSEQQKRGLFCNQYIFGNVPVFTTYLMNLGPYPQYLYISADTMKGYTNKTVTATKRLTLQIGLESMRSDFLVTKVISISNRSMQISCDFSKQEITSCGSIDLLYLINLDPGDYKLTLVADNPELMVNHLVGLTLRAITSNSESSVAFVSLRYIFFFVSLIALFYYLIFGVARIPRKLRVFEQYGVAFILGLVALFNDPFVYLTLVAPSKFAVFLSVFCTVVFVSGLLAFWLGMFERTATEKEARHTSAMKAWKIIYSIVFCAFFMTGCLGLGFAYIDNPAFSFNEHPLAYKVGFTMTAILISIALIYLIYHCVLIFKQWNSLIWRHRAFTIYSFTFLLLISLLIYSGGFFILTSDSVYVLTGVLICNTYSLLLCWLYSPCQTTKEQIADYHRAVTGAAVIQEEYSHIAPISSAREAEMLYSKQPAEILGPQGSAQESSLNSSFSSNTPGSARSKLKKREGRQTLKRSDTAEEDGQKEDAPNPSPNGRIGVPRGLDEKETQDKPAEDSFTF